MIIGVFSAFFTLFINYCIGKPAGEFSPYEIFSKYTIWLSTRRLKQVGLYNQYEKQYSENYKRETLIPNNIAVLISLKHDYHKMLYNAADPFFTWERMAGMCPVCTGFWVSLITGLYFTQSFIPLVVIILTSHIVIRLLNKVI